MKQAFIYPSKMLLLLLFFSIIDNAWCYGTADHHVVEWIQHGGFEQFTANHNGYRDRHQKYAYRFGIGAN